MSGTPSLDDVRRYLDDLPKLYALLPMAAITRTPFDASSSATPCSKPPLRLDVLHLLDTRTKGELQPDPGRVGVLPYLDSLARDIEATALDERSEPPECLPEEPTVSNTCAWLQEELAYASTLPQWDETAQGIRETWKAVRGATRAAHGAEHVQVPCNRCGAGALTRIPATCPAWECGTCGHRVTVQAVTLRQAAKLIGLPKTTLTRWAERSGILTPISDAPGRRLYDLGQLQALAARHRLHHEEEVLA